MVPLTTMPPPSTDGHRRFKPRLRPVGYELGGGEGGNKALQLIPMKQRALAILQGPNPAFLDSPIEGRAAERKEATGFLDVVENLHD